MESMKLSFEAIMPIFLLMLLGYVIRRLNLTNKKSLGAINKLIFKIFLPVLLFNSIYSADGTEFFDLKLIVFTVSGIFFVFLLGYFVVMAISKENTRRGVMLQSFFRANFAILGIPLVNYICGESAIGLTSLMIVIVIPVFNILAVVALKRFGTNEEKLNLLTLFKGVISNPLIIGCVIGIFFFALNIKLPSVVEKAVGDISSIATPLSIIVLGAEFEFTSIRGYLKEIIISVSTRLVIVPLIILSVAVCLGFSGQALACLLVTFGAPVAVSSYAMAQQMGGDEKLAAQVIVISSALCLVTLFAWIFVFDYLKLF